MKHKRFARLLSMLLVVVTMFGVMSLPANAASLNDSGTVTIQQAGYGKYLTKSSGGTIGGGYWKYTSNNGLTGTAYCVNHGLKGVSPSKALTVQEYNREPKTMGAFANGYPNRTLAQFKELHAGDVRGISGLTEDEYKYATQLAVWATCGQLAVPGTSFTAGRDTLTVPTSDAQKIRIFDSVKAILTLANGWSKHLYTGMYLRAEENKDVRGVEVIHERGLEGAAETNTDGIKKETINGKEYYTHVMYVASATSTWIDDRKTKVYSTDAPSGTIFVAENNSPLETVQENGATCYKVDTSKQRTTNLNANGSEYYGAFKVCIPVDTAADEGSFTIKATGGVAQFNLFLAYNPASKEQSYIISDPGYTTCDASATFKWSSDEDLSETASLQVVKAGAGGSPLEGAEFTLTGDKGTTVTGTTDRNGQIIWKDLPADEKFTLAETKAPEGYQIVAPMSVTLTPGRTAYLTVADDTEKGFTIKKVDGQNKASLQGAVFRFEQIDGSYTTTGTTGFDGTISFEGDELPYGSYRISEQSPPDGYVKSSRVETVEWDGTEDVTITWENDRDIGLTIVKVDEQTGVSLPNATFDVYADGQLITSVTTNDDGEAHVSGIKKEAYIEVVETAAPAGYVLDKTPHGIHIDPYDPTTEDDPVLTVTNRARPALRILKYDLTSNSPMPDVTFEVWHDGDLFGEYTTNASGEIFLYELDPGTYLVKEIATDDAHVVNSTPQQIELNAGDTQTRELVFFNSLKPGIHLIKVDSITMRSLPNVRFEFKLVGGSYRQEFTTDLNGEIDLSKLAPGAYEVRELEAPDGYLMDDAVRVVQINPDENANFVFTNTPKPALRLIKTSSDGSRLGGVHFRIAKIEDGTHYLDRITDDTGEINIPNLEPGVYSVKETATVADHILDLQEYHVELFPGQTSTITILDTQSQTVQIKEGRTVSLTFKNQPKGAIIIQKRDSATGQPLAGAEFRVTTAAGCEVGLDGVIGTSSLTQNGIFTTDAQGEIRISNLAPGAYVLNEIKAPTGYVMDTASTNVVIGQGGDTQTVIVKNSKAGTLVIDKRDSLTGKPLAGVTFKVTTSTGEYVPDASGHISSNGLYFTDKNGKITINGVVGTLVVTEVKTLPGYSIDEATRTQTVDVRPNDTQTLHFTNTPSTTLVIEKYIEGTTTPLKGVTFLVTDSSGAVVGQSNGEFITDENGRIVIEGLEPGTTVTAKEVKTLEGYVLDTSPKSIKIKEGEVQTLRFYNQKQGAIVIRKLDKQTGEPLAGVEFEITYSDGSYLDDDYGHLSSKGLYKTDANGEIRISGVVGTLVITETKPLPGYVMDEGTKTQTVKVNPTDTQTITVYNTKAGGLTIIKKDEETGKRIKGVQFEVRKLNGEIIGTYTTDTNGVISLPQAEKGWYQVVELKAAEGYKLDDTPHQIEVKDGGTAILEITNRQTGSALIHKIDSVTGKGIFGVKFLLSDAKGNPIGTYESDNEGYVYIDHELADGRYTIREIECADGYILDTQPKTIYVEYGGCTTITWPNAALRGQIQIIKKSAEYNSVNGLPAGTLLEGATFEIYNERNGALVDTIVSDNRGLAVSKPLPLGRYTIRETKAPANYSANGADITAVLEYSGQIVKFEVTNKSANTGISISKTGPKEAVGGQPVRYVFSKIGNTGNVTLQSFYWRDTLPAAVTLDKVVTGTYNRPGNYKIVYKVNNTGDYRTLADNLSTSQNYTLAASPVALGLAANERVTEIMFIFGQAPGGFGQVEAPMLYCTAVKGLTAGSSFVNVADVGGVYNGAWVQAVTRWVTTVYGKPTPLPRTGY